MEGNPYLQLSIIVPVYNVEKFIHPCLESIFRQGLDENCFEVIIVNDGTEDHSMEVIQDIVEQHKNIIVLNQENQGLSVARNNGIAVAKGEYILMPDSDDLLIDYSLKPLLEKAIETKVDLIVADFIFMKDQEFEDMHLHIPKQPSPVYVEKTGEQLFLEDLTPYHCYVWRTLYRKELIISRHLSFFPGIRYEDIAFTHECYLKANRCIRTNIILNIYRRWSGSSTLAYKKENTKNFIIALNETWNLRQNKNLPSNILYKLEEDVYKLFRLMLYHVLHTTKQQTDRNEILDYLNQNAPDINFNHSIQQRFITMMIKKTPHLFINLYYYFYKFRKFLTSQF
jgi:Glycosyltransferases involved in cell wall biogenesis